MIAFQTHKLCERKYGETSRSQGKSVSECDFMRHAYTKWPIISFWLIVSVQIKRAVATLPTYLPLVYWNVRPNTYSLEFKINELLYRKTRIFIETIINIHHSLEPSTKAYLETWKANWKESAIGCICIPNRRDFIDISNSMAFQYMIMNYYQNRADSRWPKIELAIQNWFVHIWTCINKLF